MLTKTTFDIHTHQIVYAICDCATQQCAMLTTSVVKAIQAGQCKTLAELQSLLNV